MNENMQKFVKFISFCIVFRREREIRKAMNCCCSLHIVVSLEKNPSKKKKRNDKVAILIRK